ncbi:MAG: hypothetical protein IPK00_06770 [Deltaproteobacteria bacterium]|nr:hypothetical protein [Deltaproteobacteria bacterium]
MKRVFEVDSLRCPACGGRIRLVGSITEPSVARGTPRCLSLPSRAPPLAPANDGDVVAVGIDDREPAPSDANGDPDIDFDQSPLEDLIPADAF